MNNLIKFLLKYQIKKPNIDGGTKGFTLIELLVAMIMAVLVITPLLGFMIHILSTDRQEQAKATSEQEIRTALNYISNDLQQAVYIYDSSGLSNSSTSTTPGIQDQIPPVSTASGCSSTSTCTPILVFWKRKFLSKANTNNDDAFVYSLVAYYLIIDNNSIWSNGGRAARIARFEISDGVQDTNPNDTSAVTCPSSSNDEYSGEKFISSHCPDLGFNHFDLTLAGTLQQKMNAWKKTASVYNQEAYVLVDFIDTSTTNSSTNASPSCPESFTDSTGKTITYSLISYNNTAGFYACVDSQDTIAQVYLQGNALARIQNNNYTYSDAQKTYFPNANIRVQGRGYLFTQ